jgi:HAD superfamily hydrolase (TIGR01509 family)
VIRAVVFDLDGMLLDSERVWDDARRHVVNEAGGRWRAGATASMQGMSSVEWSAYLHDELGVPFDPAQISDLVAELVLARYRGGLPLIPGAREAVARIGKRWPLGLASSSNRAVIDEVLERSGLAGAFRATVSSEEVPRGKPYPDVYLEAARQLQERPGDCAAIEDSGNGIQAALAAGFCVAAVPNREFPPPATILAQADLVVDRLPDLTVGGLAQLGGATDRSVTDGSAPDRVDEQEIESFPASDAHTDWAGPSDR